ncbi:hypothetical protein NXW75_14970 [Bacteroides xylanisolvens]|nr:hypothetical protein [Bacteroides xylanisolvens]MCS2979408.1 hypothetical protein [Bacteroides xylanisolvens]MCS3024820.1 hypothetical protein [Bacteroides xylanisolvens]
MAGMDGKGTQGIAANGCGASGDMDCGGTARTGERTDGAAGGAAAGTPPRTFVPGKGGSRAADTGRLSPPRKLVRLPAGNGGGVFPGEGLQRIPVPLPDAGKHQRLRRIPAPERALQPSGGTAVPLPP